MRFKEMCKNAFLVQYHGCDILQKLFVVGESNVGGINAAQDLLQYRHSEFRMDISFSVCNETFIPHHEEI